MLTNLIKVATEWDGKGNYINDSNTITASSFPFDPQLDEFKLYFLDTWFIQDNPDNINTKLKTYAKEQYINKKMRMNCWEFVLLCLCETGYITKEHIITLYNHQIQNNPEGRNSKGRIPDFFNVDDAINNPETLTPGYVFLRYRKVIDKNGNNKRQIWHAGIAVSDENMIDCLDNNVVISNYQPEYNTEDNGTLLVDPRLMCEKIINLVKIDNVPIPVNTKELHIAITNVFQ